MDIILSILSVVSFAIYFKVKDIRACKYSQSHQIDWGKVNNDRMINDLLNSQVNQNILNGKYNVPAVTNNSESWEDFKKRHPHGSWD